MFVKSLPYINLINNFEFYVIGLLLFLSMIIFRVIIPYQKTIQIVIVLFVVAAFVSIIEQVAISDLIGFITFVLLLLITGRRILRERDELKNIDNQTQYLNSIYDEQKTKDLCSQIEPEYKKYCTV